VQYNREAAGWFELELGAECAREVNGCDTKRLRHERR
jgi:hypothetical protein